MASQPPASQKSSSRWGSFLSSVESRLDTILADEDVQSNQDKAVAERSPEQPKRKDAIPVPTSPAESQSRTPSTNRAQDRLNERLAKALANKTLGKKTSQGSPISTAVPSRTASPVNGTTTSSDSPEIPDQKETDSLITSAVDTEQPKSELEGDHGGAAVGDHAQNRIPSASEGAVLESEISSDIPEDPQDPRSSTDSKELQAVSPLVGVTRSATPIPESPTAAVAGTRAPKESPNDYEKEVEQLRSDNEAAELRRQEETHDYLERIDALQAKLQYLTKEAAEIARNAVSGAQPGSSEHKMAKKDEQIALLLEEGQKLSQTELKHTNMIKRLRAKSGEDEKAAAEAKKTAERYQKTARDAQDKARRAEAGERQALERSKGLSKLEKDLEVIKSERDKSSILIRDLQTQLSEVTSAAKEAEQKAAAEALAEQQKLAADLAEELSNLKTEKELGEKAHHNELRSLNEKAEREKERAKIADIERQAEQETLESRLETYRARAEEASAGQDGNVQAKLLRQIETLQNQYAVASENWQGIESSLLSRITTIEKERDEMAKREADIRRKARETNVKSRRLEEDLDRFTATAHDQEGQLALHATQIAHLEGRLGKADADVDEARNKLKVEREAWEAQQASRLEDERLRIREELIRSPPEELYQQIRNESPVNRTRKSSTADKRSSSILGRTRIPGLNVGSPNFDRPLSRRSSDRRLASYQNETPTAIRSRSTSNFAHMPAINGIPETFSAGDNKADDDGFFDSFTTPATPDRATFDDIISVSTAGAGPSVQLVERMSAAVRRLESEKASHKDELARIASQRDEAREQVVEMMREQEGIHGKEERLKSLETELEAVNERYLTTLEMLGEKSEKVEELRADVEDLKGMYRELVERTT